VLCISVLGQYASPLPCTPLPRLKLNLIFITHSRKKEIQKFVGSRHCAAAAAFVTSPWRCARTSSGVFSTLQNQERTAANSCEKINCQGQHSAFVSPSAYIWMTTDQLVCYIWMTYIWMTANQLVRFHRANFKSMTQWTALQLGKLGFIEYPHLLKKYPTLLRFLKSSIANQSIQPKRSLSQPKGGAHATVQVRYAPWKLGGLACWDLVARDCRPTYKGSLPPSKHTYNIQIWRYFTCS